VLDGLEGVNVRGAVELLLDEPLLLIPNGFDVVELLDPDDLDVVEREELLPDVLE